MKPLTGKEKKELRQACEMVERFCRSVGRNCEVIFTDTGVQIAPLSDAGDTVGVNLYEAITESLKIE